MGLFSDIQDNIQKARAISAADVLVVPAQRIDTLVADPETREPRHRTDYAGTAWYGGRPQFIKGYPLPGPHAAQIEAPFWVPDSNAYAPGASGSAQIFQVSADVRQGGMAGGPRASTTTSSRRARRSPRSRKPTERCASTWP